MPAVEEKIQGAVLCADPIARPMSTPSRQRRDEIKLQIMACLIVIPALRRTAKSPFYKNRINRILQSVRALIFIPSSWGSSWQRTAIAVVNPLVMLAAKAAPIAKPSERLCIPSPAKTNLKGK